MRIKSEKLFSGWAVAAVMQVTHIVKMLLQSLVWLQCSSASQHRVHPSQRPPASYFRNMQCKAFKQQSFPLLAGHLFPRMPYVDVVVIIIKCTTLKLLPWQLIQLEKDTWQNLLRYGNEQGSHMWHSLCNLYIGLWLLPCEDLCLGFSPRLSALGCSGADSWMQPITVCLSGEVGRYSKTVSVTWGGRSISYVVMVGLFSGVLPLEQRALNSLQRVQGLFSPRCLMETAWWSSTEFVD